jgi:hypothetical protein
VKILLATPCSGGQVHWQYALSLLHQMFLHPDRLRQQGRYDVALYLAGSYSGLGKDRGIIASYALREGFDKLLFIDADQSWKWEDAKRLLDSSRGVVGGMVPLKKYPLQLNFAPHPDNRWHFDAEGVVTPKGVARWRAANTPTDEMRCSAVGTGFLCIDTKVLRKMVEAKVVEPFHIAETRNDKATPETCWDFFSTGVVDGLHLGEDYGFAVLAQRAGFEVYMNTAVSSEHYGQHTYTIPKETWAPVCDRQQVLPLQDACEK